MSEAKTQPPYCGQNKTEERRRMYAQAMAWGKEVEGSIRERLRAEAQRRFGNSDGPEQLQVLMDLPGLSIGVKMAMLHAGIDCLVQEILAPSAPKQPTHSEAQGGA